MLPVLLNLSNYFGRIYDHQNAGYAFTTAEKLLQSMSHDFASQLGFSIEHFMQEQGFSDVFIEQFVRAAMRANYGQEEDIQAFVGEEKK